ncbi:MAG: lysoplasmalogenase [Sphingomonadales bacterium]|nr:lysoplasmalogenase [Sphingomonadales bacterium]
MNDIDTQHRGSWSGIVLIAALLAGLSYYAATGLFAPSPLLIAWKGAGVGLLALWAALNARDLDGWLIALVMALGAAGDVLLEAAGAHPGAYAFLAGHIVAIGLYARNRRVSVTFSQRLLAILLVPIVLFIAFLLPENRALVPGFMLYALFVAVMAAIAWTSRFPRYLTGLGAIMFVVSDLLIFARYGPLGDSMLPGLLIWPLYFTGQAMIAIGVVTRLARSGG